jgi:very-short-patch-repair endonuclease
MTQYFNQSDHKRQRQAARANIPKGEVMLWSALKGRKMLGCKFRRQFGIGSYQLDFYCAELQLAIELDGETHYVGEAQNQDRKRQAFLESFGIRVLRFLNSDVYENLDGVWDAIAKVVREQMEQVRPETPRGRRSRCDGKREPGSGATPPAPPFLRGGDFGVALP